jgi:tRNA(Ile)-lysidine synthase
MGFSPAQLHRVLQRLPSPARYCVAYSGGLDSSVLLHAMAALRPALPAPLYALHLDHALQSASAQWLRHCQRQCAAWDIALQTRVLEIANGSDLGLEAAARAARLAAFRACIGSGDMLLMAQHRDDQAETLLLQLLRGSGPGGLSAMAPLSALPPGWMARPLLDFSRQQLRAYAAAEALDWVEDPTNAEIHFDRNYLRHEIMPRLRERWPSCSKTFARSAALCAEAEDLNNVLADHWLARVAGALPGSLSVTALTALEAPLRRAVLRRWIKQAGFLAPSRRKLAALMSALLTAAADRQPLVCWTGAQARRYRDDVLLMRPLPPAPGDLRLSWQHAGVLDLPTGLGQLRADFAKLSPPWQGAALQVRFGGYPGRCRVVAARHHKTLKKLYQEHAIPHWVRPYVPLVFHGEALLSVAGWWCCELPGRVTVPFHCRWEGHPFTRFIGNLGG